MQKKKVEPETPPRTDHTPILIIQEHLVDLHRAQSQLQAQADGVANQIFILEHILKDMGVTAPEPTPSTTGPAPDAPKTPEGSTSDQPPTPPQTSGEGVGSIIL